MALLNLISLWLSLFKCFKSFLLLLYIFKTGLKKITGGCCYGAHIKVICIHFSEPWLVLVHVYIFVWIFLLYQN